jgi:beta-glucanase (GH16 family)
MAMLGLLSACSGQQSDNMAAEPIGDQTTSRPSISAAELSNDAVSSVSFAQAVAAGITDNPDFANAGEPDSGAATPDVTDSASNTPSAVNPLAIIPTANLTDSNTDSGVNLGVIPEPQDGSTQPASTPDQSEPVVEQPAPTDSTAETPVQNQGNTVTQTPVTVVEGEAPTSTIIDQQASNPDPTSISPNSSSGGDSTNTKFSSSTTPGFIGEVLADTIKISWAADPAARGYNVYRQAQYITTVFSTDYVDEDVYDSDYYYEIQAFNFSDELYYIATGLTVSARTLDRTDPNAPAPNAEVLQGYELVFSDEFNGSQLDASKWNTSYLWGADLVINNEEQYYVDILDKPDFGYNPFTFDGNNLTINSIRTPEELSPKALNQPYLSGVITSYDAFKFTYGYIETRAKVTYGRGYWPAFWLLNAYYVDDKPEIDIMEFIGQDQDVVYHTYHYYDSAGELRSTKSLPTPGIDYTSDFHTYAAEWKPGTIVFYIDGIEKHRITDPKVSRQDMYVIANTALGGWWAGSPDNTTPFPGEFTLDYIRVYQKITPYNDDTFFNDGITSVPYADDIPNERSPNHRPSREDWPAGYPDGL